MGDQQQQQASLLQPAAVRDLSAVEGADGDASPAAAAAAAAGDGAATPEGERSSSEDSHNAPGEASGLVVGRVPHVCRAAVAASSDVQLFGDGQARCALA